ncbi:alkaline phosphatase D family protein [Haloactinopolyspora sp.]|uniref:alkaline phosphatase D family protein n=1 Tax=Haloactinopolyspora sp. TaxID=1966353 RepID=UPI00261B5B25|nr:alkaline phosphatase D family protein [Haloactinopolyspora sp.]
MTDGIVVGPMLRHVGPTSAAIWVETDRPCVVGALDATAATFAVHGHHYALLEIDGLEPATTTEYHLTIDGETVWPDPDSSFPPPRIRTRPDDTADEPVRMVFGSCRMSVPHDARHRRIYGVDALRTYAHQVAHGRADWPDALLLLGDQVYADETAPQMQQFIAARRDTSQPPGTEVADFEEYAHLYRLAWSDPAVRWLLSTVPSAMIFDDHDIRDDWNTSRAWREQMADEPWWPDRITGGLAAYWLYQHLGNLSPDERADDPVLAAVRESDDGGKVLHEFARTADRDPSSYRWSFARDIGPVRLIMIDSRCGRMLEPGRRTIVDDAEWAWIDAHIRSASHADHVLIGTSLPYLLPPGLHSVEAWNESVADGAWGERWVKPAETMRQVVDLEHWAAFGHSFRAMERLITDVATAPGGHRPQTITFLSGDVHYSYAARMSYPGESDTTSRVHQLVCSPLRNPLNRAVRYLNGAAAFAVARAVGAPLAKRAGVPASTVSWRVDTGPRFDNAIATLDLTSRSARVHWDTGVVADDGETSMKRILETDL